MERALVTGGTGVTGNALVRVLAAKGVGVTVLLRPGSPRKHYLEGIPGVYAVDCDMTQYGQIDSRLRGQRYDAFFHLAWDGSRGKEKTDNRNAFALQARNLQLSLEAVELCARLDCPVFLMTGSQAEYGRKDHPIQEEEEKKPENGYGMAKLCAEGMTRLLCRERGIRHIWPILFSIFGPNDATESLIDTSIRGLLRGQTLPYTAGEQIWDYLYSCDAAEALILLAEKGADGETYNVGSGHQRPLRQYIQELYEVLAPDRPPRLGELPYGPNQVMYLAADTEKLHRATGFVPACDFRTGVRRIAEEIRKEGP